MNMLHFLNKKTSTIKTILGVSILIAPTFILFLILYNSWFFQIAKVNKIIESLSVFDNITRIYT